MPITKYYFSPSINIIRDLDKNLDYIPTTNAKQVYNQIVNNFTTGTHSFNIIGSYGTGKSSFLLALEQQLNEKKNYFTELNGSFTDINGFVFLPIIGSYSSLLDCFANLFGLKNEDYKTQDVLFKIEAAYSKILKTGKGWLIAIDEFGKFLEYAAINNPERELYFIQLLAELVNDNSKKIILISALHQGFNDYAISLSKYQRNEWDKVKGRLKEITFNEPVEQLLLLAAERISSKRSNNKIIDGFDDLFYCIARSKTFPLNDYFNQAIARKLLPFDILSASILTLALQRYGQNERSLFQFIDSNDHFGIEDFDIKVNPFYNISCVYDYLLYNHYSIITSKHNPNFSQWVTIRNSIERVEGELGNNSREGVKIIKAIGLLNIFTNNSGVIDDNFLYKYSQISLGIENPQAIVDKLKQFKIIAFAKYNNRYRLLEGTDLDIEEAISNAEIEKIVDIGSYLIKHFDFPYILAKEYFFRTGCPRYFKFLISDRPFIEPVEEVDGIINLIFSDTNYIESILSKSLNLGEPILYCLFHNTKIIQELLLELERINFVKRQHLHDKVAQREIDVIIDHLKFRVNEVVIGGLYMKNENITWIYSGQIINISSHKILNRQLSRICDDIYHATPIFKNEMVNKSKISGSMQPARKNLIKALVSDFDKPNLGFPDDKFPPEKTIYLSLIKNTGIHDGYTLSEPSDVSFKKLWNKSVNFLEDAKVTRLNLEVLIQRLKEKPFGLKQGFIDFWLPIFLFIRKDDYALFDTNGYVPNVDNETLLLLSKQPHSFEIKSFDISGIKLDLFNSYRNFLNFEGVSQITNNSLIELIKPFLVFYTQLPEYNKKTKRISKRAIKLRDAISLSKEPEKTFFEDFPRAMEYSLESISGDPGLVNEYIVTLQNLVREIRTAYEELINRVENFILDEFIGQEVQFKVYKKILQLRFKKIKKHMLLPKQRIFYQRLMSEVEVRNSWISSICQAILGKSLDLISDEEELILFENFRNLVNELDNLCILAKGDVDLEKEDIFNIEITSFLKGLQKHTLRMPKGKMNDFKELELVIKEKLSHDRSANIALLLKLLLDEIDE